jgi:hypothetical protein
MSKKCSSAATTCKSRASHACHVSCKREQRSCPILISTPIVEMCSQKLAPARLVAEWVVKWFPHKAQFGKEPGPHVTVGQCCFEAESGWYKRSLNFGGTIVTVGLCVYMTLTNTMVCCSQYNRMGLISVPMTCYSINEELTMPLKWFIK